MCSDIILPQLFKTILIINFIYLKDINFMSFLYIRVGWCCFFPCRVHWGLVSLCEKLFFIVIVFYFHFHWESQWDSTPFFWDVESLPGVPKIEDMFPHYCIVIWIKININCFRIEEIIIHGLWTLWSLAKFKAKVSYSLFLFPPIFLFLICLLLFVVTP